MSDVFSHSLLGSVDVNDFLLVIVYFLLIIEINNFLILVLELSKVKTPHFTLNHRKLTASLFSFLVGMIEISSLSLTADFSTEPPVLAALNMIMKPESRDLLYLCSHLFILVRLLGDPRVCSVDMVLKQFILTKRGRADGAFVGEVGGLQGLAMVLGNVVQQLPLINLEKNIV